MTFEKVRLADCCIIKPPKSEAKKLLSSDDKVSFVPMNNLGIDHKSLTLDNDKKLSDVSGSYTYFAENDVLLAKITPCFENGKLGIATGLTNGIGFGSSEFIVFRSKGNIDPNYLYYYLLQPSFREVGKKVMTGAVGHKRVPKDYIENTKIPLPSIPEQKRIVAILDQVFADIEQARAKTEQNLKNARELFESYLQQVFSQRGEGWVKCSLECLVTDDCSLSYGIVQPGDDVSGGLAIVRPTDLKNELIDINGLKLIDSSKAEGYKRTILQGGELLVCVRGDTGVTSIACESIAGANVTRGIVPIRFNPEKILSRFGYYQFISPLIQTQIKAATYGAALMQINIRDFRKINISAPPLDIQAEIIDRLDAIRPDLTRLEKIYTSKLSALDSLKKSILQKAFSGELTKTQDGDTNRGATA